MAYTSREILDRIAVGDNCFYMEQLSDGRVKLTPAPDSVTTEGTAINRELLQLIEDRVVFLMNTLNNNITANPFVISFDSLDDITVEGIYNKTDKRVEC